MSSRRSTKKQSGKSSQKTARVSLRPRSRSVVFPKEQRAITTAVLVLVAIGTVMVYSASSAENALASGGSGMGMFLRTLVLGVVPGAVFCVLLQRYELAKIRALVTPALIVAVGLLFAVMLPGIGRSVNGASRWIGLGPFTFQPSEIAKVVIVLYLADQAIRYRGSLNNLRAVWKPCLLPIIGCAGLIAAEPDLGTTIVCVGTGFTVLWMAGMKLRVMGPVLVGMFVLGGTYTAMNAERLSRLTAFLHPFDPETRVGSGFQAVQGQIAIGSGGLTGVGLGESVQKIFYLPEAHTDFILAVIGEELGFLAIAVILAMFGLLMRSGMNLARDTVDPYAKLVAGGLTALITTQAMLNIWVVLGIAPLTGVPLPFISYGPTSLVVLLSATGLLLNIAISGGTSLRALDGNNERDTEAQNADLDRSGRYGGSRHTRAQRR
jgi:cell division protein FtsW